MCVCLSVYRDDYFRMKLQWKSIDADQESRFSDLRDRRSLIGLSTCLSLCLCVCVCSFVLSMPFILIYAEVTWCMRQCVVSGLVSVGAV